MHFSGIIVIAFSLTFAACCVGQGVYSYHTLEVFLNQTHSNEEINPTASEKIVKPIASTASLILIICCCMFLLFHVPRRQIQAQPRQRIPYPQPREHQEIGRITHATEPLNMQHTRITIRGFSQ